MEVASPRQPQGWPDWKREIEEQRRRRWRDRVMRWTRENVSKDEEDEEEESDAAPWEGNDEEQEAISDDEGVRLEDTEGENVSEGEFGDNNVDAEVEETAEEEEVEEANESDVEQVEGDEEELDDEDHQEEQETQSTHSSAGSVEEEDGEYSGFGDEYEEDAPEYYFFEGILDRTVDQEKREDDPGLSVAATVRKDKDDINSKMFEEEDEESTDDEVAEDSSDDECYDESVQKVYCKEHHAPDLFLTLAQFRERSLLTDLTLLTKDGATFCVHAPVLAAVSSLIRTGLPVVGVSGDSELCKRSLSLDVDHDSLEAIVDFAYTGHLSKLHKDTVEDIKAAAETLCAPRVLHLCKSFVRNSEKTADARTALQQMVVSLQSIKRLQEERVGCDVILDVHGASFHAHRVILAACSDYFRGMFSLGMRESYQSHVHLPFLPASELEVLIGSSYTGSVHLSWRCVFEVTCLSLQLQYQPALSLSLKYLHEELNPHSCLDVASFAEAYQMTHLLELADDYVLRQFPKVSRTAKFKYLPAKQLLRYLTSSSLNVPCELVVFRAVANWIQAKPKRRFRLAKELMKTIHFPLMTFKEFKEVRSLEMWSDQRLADIYEAVHDEFCSESAPQSQCRVYLPKEILVVSGGDQISEDMALRSISRELWFGNSLMNQTGIKKAMEWRLLGEMPESPRFAHEVAVFKGQLYVFGGNRYYGVGDTLSSVYRYNPLQNSWERLADMGEHRCTFSVVILDGNMLAIGGHSDPDYKESVERYSPTTNAWSFTRPLDLPLGGHVARVLHGQIYVSGGMNNDFKCLSSMFVYQPEAGSTYLATMAKPRAHHCMETLGDHLYVAGGFTVDDGGTVLDQLDCEVYNPATDSWAAFTSLPVPHVGAGSAVLEGKFYVLGGYSREDYSERKMVHRYDPAIHRWENMGKTAGPNNDIRAAVLCLPAHARL
ncbi:kelch-like protein 33 [Neosynchiropus ocellatus]